jgi:hypothetical protein
MTVLKTIFCKLYQWFLPNALSPRNAALNVMGFFSLFLTANIISAYWILTNLIGSSLSIFSTEFGQLIILFLPFFLCFIIYLLFIKKNIYLTLYKKILKNDIHVWGFSAKTFTILYLFISVILFVIGMLLTTSRPHLSAVSQ